MKIFIIKENSSAMKALTIIISMSEQFYRGIFHMIKINLPTLLSKMFPSKGKPNSRIAKMTRACF